ncbi:MAG: FAD-dependent monooxygenase [Solirubrobacterales bacterium]|nr:FAD-dependent monooxygenase [Solirubrobacterales bacterium]MBV9715458.1 FAD-dependent monooxygenase [Solirubrobacterales bacterium]
MRRFITWHDPIAQILHATDPTSVLRHDVYHLRPHPSRYVNGRLVLLGDAAHAMTPDLGQGACQALEDAATLQMLIESHADLATASARYDASRRPRASLIASRSRQLGRLGQLSGARATALRNRIMYATPARITNRQLDRTLIWHAPSP